MEDMLEVIAYFLSKKKVVPEVEQVEYLTSLSYLQVTMDIAKVLVSK